MILHELSVQLSGTVISLSVTSSPPSLLLLASTTFTFYLLQLLLRVTECESTAQGVSVFACQRQHAVELRAAPTQPSTSTHYITSTSARTRAYSAPATTCFVLHIFGSWAV